MRGVLRRHSVVAEVAIVLVGYLVYDSSRGLVGGGRKAAVTNARAIATVERALGLGVERSVQRAARHVPGLLSLFGIGYMALHLGATVLMLVWAYRRGDGRPYATMRTALLVASALGLTGFVLLPTAPPRLASLGLADTVSNGPVNLNGSLRWLYNPYAAMPSVHIAYAVVVGVAVYRYTRRRMWQVLSIAYPLWVTAEVVATSNHFVLDVVAGALVGALSLGTAGRLTRAIDDSDLRVAPPVPSVSEHGGAHAAAAVDAAVTGGRRSATTRAA
jgi:hypothetical protein